MKTDVVRKGRASAGATTGSPPNPREDPEPVQTYAFESALTDEEPWFFDPELFSLDKVKELILGTGYPPEFVHFVRGRVEDTAPYAATPPQISLLRLDTDWYVSKHELMHCFPDSCGTAS